MPIDVRPIDLNIKLTLYLDHQSLLPAAVTECDQFDRPFTHQWCDLARTA
jgi:hypothetical protein